MIAVRERVRETVVKVSSIAEHHGELKQRRGRSRRRAGGETKKTISSGMRSFLKL